MTDERSPIEDLELQMPDDMDIGHCYRHPNRETGVSCSNCGRPICHECMTPAAVGFRCPECMAQQRRKSGRARVVTRQQMRGRWQGGFMGSRGMSLTKVLVAINAIMFVIELATGAARPLGYGSTQRLVDLGALVPYDVIYRHEYWRLVSAMFLHAGIFHVLFNMWALWVVGDYLEAALGRLRFALVYFVSGLAGSVLVVLVAPLVSVTVGASGAVFGTFASLFVYSYLNRQRDLAARLLLRNMAFIILINLVFTFMVPGISWQGHVGGLAAGAVVTAVLLWGGRKDPRESIGAAEWLAVAGIVALVAVALVAKVGSAGQAPFVLGALLPFV